MEVVAAACAGITFIDKNSMSFHSAIFGDYFWQLFCKAKWHILVIFW